MPHTSKRHHALSELGQLVTRQKLCRYVSALLSDSDDSEGAKWAIALVVGEPMCYLVLGAGLSMLDEILCYIKGSLLPQNDFSEQ